MYIQIIFTIFVASIIKFMTTESIIIFFCQQTGVDHTLIYRRDHNGKLWNTRYMIWHYLHCVKDIPTSELCRMFNRNRPTIFRGIRIFREHSKYHKDIRDRYNSIVNKLEGMAEATPSAGNMEEKDLVRSDSQCGVASLSVDDRP